jgi:integrase
MVLFAAATRLRPSELFALEQRDVDRAAGVVQIRRAYANGESSTRRRGSAPRLTPDGQRDQSFGNKGTAVTTLSPGSDPFLSGVAI